MSTISLNSNHYYSTTDYLDLLNSFLIEVNFAKETGKQHHDARVESFFADLLNSDCNDPGIELVRSLFSRYYRDKKQDFKTELNKIATGLLRDEIENQTVQAIGALVNVIKFYCAQSYARMKGPKI